MRKPTIEIWQGGTFLLYDSIEGVLYNEDGTEYKPPKPVTPPKPAATYTPPKPQPKPQMSLFELMENNANEEKPSENAQDVSQKAVQQDDPGSDDEEPTAEELREAAETEEDLPLPAMPEKTKAVQMQGSPFYQRYMQIQNKYPDHIVLFSRGDFYEVFGKNAELLADELSLTLTSRDCGFESRVQMIGFPYHASDVYFGKILSNGHTLVVMENDDEIHKLPSTQDVDLETGEILSEEEMREFDGDIEEPDFSDDEPNISAFDIEALAVLDEMFGKEITLR